MFVHDRVTRQTSRVSLTSTGEEIPAGTDSYTAISGDGRYVAFQSRDNMSSVVYIHDRSAGQARRIYPGYGRMSLSGDGRYLSFTSSAADIVLGDTNLKHDVFLYDRQTETVTRVSVASDGTQANGYSNRSSVSSDGRSVGFTSDATNLVPGDTNGVADIFIHDRLNTDSGGGTGGGGGEPPHPYKRKNCHLPVFS